jgi:hypothetical protein
LCDDEGKRQIRLNYEMEKIISCGAAGKVDKIKKRKEKERKKKN